ncbi:MAG: hypothetical protein QGF38_03575 [Rhodospirillales bacterium]|jgi:hypothetical protein|nr:hypothetical protein [Rhodospirillales bacterium]MDP7650767.1 hypothetical protein [Rhodospirillales bacterium]HJO97408.1 hypothetical protein [Rhodospirillales bacterium]
MIRTTTLMSLLLGVVLTVVLFSLEFQVRKLEDELAALDRAIVAESQAIHVLKAEWSYLNDPWRLRRLAERFLRLTPVRPEQLSTLANLPRRPLVGAKGRAANPAETTALADGGQRR